jgi:hypothetical protein
LRRINPGSADYSVTCRRRRAGHDRCYFLQPDHEGQREGADEQRQPARLVEVREQVSRLLEEVPLALLDAEDLRQLADDDREREPDDEALQHRLRDEAGEEAEAEEPGDESQDPGDDPER